mmetsp:Transcript_107669/g.131385  ORF Transcript_107669/g.131385 Transcript_107669/m.131385 type:complete len:461 (+) Transcript_107669:52-1434(+)
MVIITTTGYVSIILNAILLCVCLPVSINGCYRMYLLRDTIFVKKRHPNVLIATFSSYIVSQIVMFVTSPILTVYGVSHITMSILGVFWISAFFYTLFGVTVTYWMKLFTFNWSNAITKCEWRYIITNKEHKNWYMKHKDTYGNPNYVLKHFGIIYGIIGLIGFTSFIVGYIINWNGHILSIIIGRVIPVSLQSIMAVAFFVIILKTQKFEDLMFITQETRYHFYLLIFWVVCFCGSFAMGIIGDILKWDTETRVIYTCIWMLPIAGLIGFAGLVVSTFVVINNFMNDKSIMIENLRNELSADNPAYSIHNIIGHKVCMESFMKHLLKELSIECMTSYIEFTQYEKLFDKHKHDPRIFYDGVPESNIVYNESKDIKWKAYQLYMKYIASFSKYEINVSYHTRLYLTNLMDYYDVWIKTNISNDELCDLFKKSKQEVMKLMRDAFNRFKNTEEWIKVLKNLE